MNKTLETPPAKPKKSKTVRKLRRFFRVLFARKLVILCTVILVIMALAAVFASFVAPFNPYSQNLGNSLSPANSTNILGTDMLGRDVFSRIVYGTRVSFSVGIVSVAFSGLVGMVLGVVSGVAGGVVDSFIMRVMDAMLAIPLIILAMFLGAVFGQGLGNVMLAVGIAMIPSYARLTRGQVLTIREMDYVTAGTIFGASKLRNAVSHIVPNCIAPNIVLMTMNLGGAILAEANLSFLGLGINPPTASWGAMVSDGFMFLSMHPVIAIAPGIFILLIVLCFNIVGDAVRDALDPRLRGTF
ncbi:MAG: ABC transporter permease [Defluviitaleaceae bacterium]|nr:ABC transporter permease [Defluviitaleaceae bacterium]